MADAEKENNAVLSSAAEGEAQANENAEGKDDKLSLLDVVIDEYNLEADKRTSRILLMGTLVSGTSPEEAEEWHKKLVEEALKKEVVTGVCFLVDDTSLSHMLEASSGTITKLLRALKPGTEGCILKDVRICSLSEEVIREYPVWVFRQISVEDSGFEKGEDSWLNTVFSAVENLLELGRECGPMGNAKAQEFLMGSTDRKTLTSRVPSASMIKSFEKCPDLFTVDAWLEVFDVPIDFTLEGEKVWPVEPPLRY